MKIKGKRENYGIEEELMIHKDISKISIHDLRNAMDNILAGRTVRAPDTKPFGYSIKWML